MRSFFVVSLLTLCVVAFGSVLHAADKPSVSIPSDFPEMYKAMLTPEVITAIEKAGEPKEAYFRTVPQTGKNGNKFDAVLLIKKSDQLGVVLHFGMQSGSLKGFKNLEVVISISGSSAFASSKDVLVVFIPWDKEAHDFGDAVVIDQVMHTKSKKGEPFCSYMGTGVPGYYVIGKMPKEAAENSDLQAQENK